MKKTILIGLCCSIVCIGQSQIITTIAGNGVIGNSGDGGPAVNAQLKYPVDVVCDHLGNTYITDEGNDAVRKIDASGIITHFATVYQPGSIACDKYNNIYVTSQSWQSVLKITPAGVSAIFAGTAAGSATFSGDGGLATLATLNYPYGIAIDTAGNVYVSTTGDARIRKIDNAGIISTFAGSGQSMYGPSGDGGMATLAFLASPRGIAFDKSGDLYVAEQANQVRKIDPTGIITRVAGSYTAGAGYTGNGGLSTLALLNNPVELAVDTLGNVYISDMGNQVIRKIDVNGIITTVVGNGFTGGLGGAAGKGGYAGDGGNPLLCELNNPWGITFNHAGELIISDWYNHAIRKIGLVDFIKEETGKSIVSIFPNPGNGIYHLYFSSLSNVSISDAFGQEIKAMNRIEGNYDLDLCNQAPGIYFVRAYQNGIQQTVKLVKY